MTTILEEESDLTKELRHLRGAWLDAGIFSFHIQWDGDSIHSLAFLSIASLRPLSLLLAAVFSSKRGFTGGKGRCNRGFTGGKGRKADSGARQRREHGEAHRVQCAGFQDGKGTV